MDFYLGLAQIIGIHTLLGLSAYCVLLADPKNDEGRLRRVRTVRAARSRLVALLPLVGVRDRRRSAPRTGRR